MSGQSIPAHTGPEAARDPRRQTASLSGSRSPSLVGNIFYSKNGAWPSLAEEELPVESQMLRMEIFLIS